jgi:hypothetical protein
MRRREFITLLGGAAAWVSPAGAQEPRKVIGILGSTSSSKRPPLSIPASRFIQNCAARVRFRLSPRPRAAEILESGHREYAGTSSRARPATAA